MTYGIEVTDVSGRVIIDSNYPHMVEVASGSITPNKLINNSYSSNGEKLRLGRISTNGTYGDNLVFAVKLPEKKWIRIGRKSEDGLGRGNIDLREMEFNTEDSSTIIKYKIFANTKYVNRSSETYGLWVWDESGGLIFDSGLKTFNVIGNYIKSKISMTGSQSTYVGDLGSDWFIPGVFSSNVLAETGNPNVGIFHSTFIMLKSGKLYASLRSISTGPPPSGEGDFSSYGPVSITRIKIT